MDHFTANISTISILISQFENFGRNGLQFKLPERTSNPKQVPLVSRSLAKQSLEQIALVRIDAELERYDEMIRKELPHEDRD